MTTSQFLWNLFTSYETFSLPMMPSHFLWNFHTSCDNFSLLVKPSHFMWNHQTSYETFTLCVKTSHFLWILQFQIEWNSKRRINDRWWWYLNKLEVTCIYMQIWRGNLTLVWPHQMCHYELHFKNTLSLIQIKCFKGQFWSSW